MKNAFIYATYQSLSFKLNLIKQIKKGIIRQTKSNKNSWKENLREAKRVKSAAEALVMLSKEFQALSL